MSNIYIQEPPTKGKVLLKTSVGDIDLELWSKEAPLACRNFVQLCLEGYYNGTVFHRVVRGLCVQGGDPTGTGEGGQSVYGKPFKDEFHQRLRFVRRGLVAMANSGPNDNCSQFFFTLDRADHLHGKHTIFAKVTGKTVYNMLKLAEVEVDGEDRPLHPHKIKATEVLFNPFDDIVPREIIREEKKEKKEEAKSTARATKNFKLLSFGDEAEEDEEEVNAVTEELRPKGKSSHDLLKDDPRLSSVPAVPTSPSAADNQKRKKQDSDDSSDSDQDSDSPDEDKEAIKEKIRKKLKTTANVETPAGEEKVETDQDTKSRIEALREETRALKRELQRRQKAKQEEEEEKERMKEEEKEEKEDALADFHSERQKYLEKKQKEKKKGGSREEETLALLSKFQNKLFSVRKESTGEEEEEEQEEEEEEEEQPLGDSWMAHRLHFEAQQVQAKDANVVTADSYDIYDPRNPMNKRRMEASKQAMKEKGRKFVKDQ
ncbi:PREDICTED: peptidyl-prolyl cis-trans isomerase CWC27 homolog [Branchiostoma belcheri]|uniref:Spliceosome-associated protein CWC27 homolog n=1 Tax=Branchiostoma belcheri TaxID=7741 RepID=A0A6P4XC37_BRABE|nr:PREDICTED: peptidyl-prolyl cis-trans isomerase CWC27 homolog [Branchiostoma belcheri]